MTTAAKVTRPTGSARVLSGAALLALAVAVGLVVAAAIFSGRPGLLGAATGSAIALGVFLFGSFTLNVVAGLMPGLSLLVAMTTYLFQVLLVLVALVSLDRSDLMGDTLSRGWTGAAVVVLTLVWSLGQLWLYTRARIPTYDVVDPSEDRT